MTAPNANAGGRPYDFAPEFIDMVVSGHLEPHWRAITHNDVGAGRILVRTWPSGIVEAWELRPAKPTVLEGYVHGSPMPYVEAEAAL